MKIIFDDVATLTNTRNEKSVEAEVDNIRDQTSLDAFIKHENSYEMERKNLCR